MKNYNLKQEVDWRKVMEIMRWHMVLRQHQLEKHRQISKELGGFARDELREDLELYQALRAFLRNSKPAKIELKIREILEADDIFLTI